MQILSRQTILSDSGGPSNGFITNFNSTTGVVEYNPLPAFHGEDSFTFKGNDGKDKSLTSNCKHNSYRR